ncbi:MAG TPA: hypothetical protein DHW82_13970 [Spirochaetia bacterium]|nr:hypothetical protein [Spirochaetia bacterium]
MSQEKKTEEKTCIQEEITCPECPEIKTDSLSYSQKSVIELGGAGWVELKGLKGGSLSQRIWISPFVSYFVLDYFLMGIRGDFDYSLDSKTYVMAAYYVVGTALPLTEKLFFVVDMNLGYSKNSSSSSNLFSYGNEVGIKYEISKHFLLGFTAVYNFYTDFSTEYFNDKIKAMISFSGYF